MESVLKSFLQFLQNATIGQWMIVVAGLPLIGYMIFMIFAFGWKSRPVKGPDRWYEYVMLSYLLSFLWMWMISARVQDRANFLSFLPVNLILWPGPVLFHFIKSKLYRNFRFRPRDLKHFIFPLAHLSFYFFAFALPPMRKYNLFLHEYHAIYKPFEDFSFGVIIFLYCYFAYRFIKHEQWSINESTPKAEIVKISWLQRFFKVFFLSSFVHLAYGLFSMANAFIFRIEFENNYLELLHIFVFMICMGWLGFHAVLMKALPKSNI